ncbi:MICAL-like protein 1 [Ptychodera flava]|uniref:MICAL-like protein 1 n=1 Tax=Ptychodera flava TaxID=63121 RepID=UPI00396A4509
MRREHELHQLSRQQTLEEKQARVESEIRLLQTVNNEEHKEITTDLLKKLEEIVQERNRIVDTMEQDRLRELQEDKSVKAMMIKKGWIDNP